MTRVLLAGGGTAGHVSPLLALADCLRRRDPASEVLALGTAQGLESRLVPDRGYELATVPKVAMPRRPSGDLLRLPARLSAAVGAAGDAIDQVRAEVVVGFGGYVSTPAYLAARRRGIPIVVHEQNARPGLANRVGARLTRHVAVTFAGTPLPHAQVIGMPLRREVAAIPALGDPARASAREDARAELGLDGSAPVLLVTGGSLGAQRLNEAFGAAAPRLVEAGAQVLHVCGRGKTVPVGTTGAPLPGYQVREYLDRMDLAYAAADLVVCRAGAGTVCELTAVGLPAVYIPLPIGNGEQRLNAAEVVAAGGGELVDDAEVSPSWVEQVVLPLLGDPARRESMAAAADALGRRQADEQLADMVLAAAGQRR